MCETIAKVVVALNIGMTVSLFIYQVNTTENVGQILDHCATEYKDYCMNEEDCFSYVEENIIGCLPPPLYGRKRCDKFFSQLKSDVTKKFYSEVWRVFEILL